jgi:hypothetical protein
MKLDNNILNIINEEISQSFNFLSNDDILKEQEENQLLNNEDFQKQFICDSLLNTSNKIKFIEFGDGNIGGNWEEDPENATNLSIDQYIKLEFKYDSEKDPIVLELNFDGDISIIKSDSSEQGDYNRPSYSEAWFNGFDWNDVNVSLYDSNGNKIEFVALKKAPNNIRILFVKIILEYCL